MHTYTKMLYKNASLAVEHTIELAYLPGSTCRRALSCNIRSLLACALWINEYNRAYHLCVE